MVKTVSGGLFCHSSTSTLIASVTGEIRELILNHSNFLPMTLNVTGGLATLVYGDPDDNIPSGWKSLLTKQMDDQGHHFMFNNFPARLSSVV